MKTKILSFFMFVIRLIAVLIVLFAAFAKNTMMYLDTAGIGEIINLLEKYKMSFSLDHIDGKELFMYKIIYLINEYYIQIIIITIIIWITIEAILMLFKKDRRSNI